MPVSKAQASQSPLLMRPFGNIERGAYVDIGARDDDAAAFYKQGWRGVHVEATSTRAEMLEKTRPGERVIRAVVRERGDPLMLYCVGEQGLVTGDAALAADRLKTGHTVTVMLAPSVTLSEVLEGVGAPEIHWLRLIGDSTAPAALRSWGKCPVRPLVVVVDSPEPASDAARPETWEPQLLQRGYQLARFDGASRIYLRADRLDLKSALGGSVLIEPALAGAAGASVALIDEITVLKSRNAALERALLEVRASSSWKVSAPIRWSGRAARVVARGTKSWLLFKPGGRPHRLVRKLVRRRPAPLFLPASRSAPLYVMVGHTADCNTNTGVQRVVRGLCKALLGASRTVRFVRWDEELNACVLIDIEQRERLGLWNGPRPSREDALIYPTKEAAAVPVKPHDGAAWLIVPEVPHMAFGETPVTARITDWAHRSGLRSGWVFYDAIPLRRPELAAGAHIHAQYMEELRLADAVWPISRWSANELVSFWGVQADEPQPMVDPIHLPPEFDRPRRASPIAGEKLILSVGTVEPRKNQVGLIRAFQQILAERPDCGWRLLIAGNLHPLAAPEVDAACKPGSAIEFRGYITDTELSALYQRCAFTVFPSLEEGYGLPILESLWQAKPCLCANFGSMAEVAQGGGCLTTDVGDPIALKTALERLIDDEVLRARLADEAIHRAMPSWPDYVAAMETALGGHERHIYYWVDSTVSTPVNTGIQRVVRQAARALIEAGFKLIPVKWGGPEQPMHPVTREELEHFARWNGPPADSWSPWIEPALQGGGWFVTGELPLHLSDAEQKSIRARAREAGLKTAAIFHDTIPWKLRGVYPEAFARAHLLYIGELRHYDQVMAVSRHSQGEMIKVLREDLRLDGAFAHIVANPLPAEFPERSEDPAPASHALAKIDRPIEVLCVGTVEPRKNHERMLAAFELACQALPAPMRLTLVGSGHSIDPDLAVRVRARIAANPLMSWEEHASDARIRDLYRQCDFTIYPSIEEGFGIPILESLWYGKPVITADFGAMSEAAEGGGCLLVDTRDIGAMAEAITQLARSSELRARLGEEAKTRSFQTWAEYAAGLVQRLGLWTRPSQEAINDRRSGMGLKATKRTRPVHRAEFTASV